MQELKDYFLRLKNLLQLEKEEEIKTTKLYFENTGLKTQKAEGVTWHPIRIKEEGYGLGDYPFLVVERQTDLGESHQFKSGQTVGLFSSKHAEPPIKGLINYVAKDEMKIVFHLDQLPDWIENGALGVQLLFDEGSFKEMELALNFFTKTDDKEKLHLVKTLLGYAPLKQTNLSPIQLTQLNASQNEAVNAVLASQKVSIIHGPPGTGKTTTLVETIAELCKKEQPLLVTAPSNAAVDLITKKLLKKGINTVRVGNLSKIDDELFSHTLDYIVNNSQENKRIKELKKQAIEYRRLASQYKRSFGREEREQRKALYQEAKSIAKEIVQIENHIIEKTLQEAQVITCTLVGANNYYLRDMLFETAIIDEAGQALEPACWIPLVKSKKVVLAGDPLQLPPTVKSEEAKKLGLSKTLIEKAIAFLPSSLLNRQYRMNEQIMAFSNVKFYKGALQADSSVAEAKLPNNPFPVIEFIDTAGCGYNEEQVAESTGMLNKEEAALLKKHLEELQSIDLGMSIGIISPYRKQVELLMEEISPQKEITINTIDSFQGQEREVIYISLVRSNNEGNIGFLKDYRRMNVAMTRAKKKLVLIGDSATLANDKFYDDLLNFINKNNYYRSAWEYYSE